MRWRRQQKIINVSANSIMTCSKHCNNQRGKKLSMFWKIANEPQQAKQQKITNVWQSGPAQRDLKNTRNQQRNINVRRH